MGVVVPISNQPSPFGELESGAPGASARPNEANLLMALSTMHKMGRFDQQDEPKKKFGPDSPSDMEDENSILNSARRQQENEILKQKNPFIRKGSQSKFGIE